jgi:hypothetical protein
LCCGKLLIYGSILSDVALIKNASSFTDFVKLSALGAGFAVGNLTTFYFHVDRVSQVNRATIDFGKAIVNLQA